MKKFFLSLLTILALAVPVQHTLVYAGTTPSDAARKAACEGISGTVGGNCASAASGNQLSKIVKAVLNILSLLAAIAAVIMIIVSGLKYVTSGGDSNSISSAKQTLIYAIVGLIIVASAQLIVRFVLNRTA